MYCAAKEDCLGYVIFQGGASYEYPEWVQVYMESFIIDEDEDYTISIRKRSDGDTEMIDWEDVLVEGHDVFIKSQSGRVKHLDVKEFNNHFMPVADGTCAPYEMVFECLYVYGEPLGNHIYPSWYKELYDNDLRYMKNKDIYPFVVIKRSDDVNKVPWAQIVDVETFEENYYGGINGLPWAKLKFLGG